MDIDNLEASGFKTEVVDSDRESSALLFLARRL
jgi:hypothetical protein